MLFPMIFYAEVYLIAPHSVFVLDFQEQSNAVIQEPGSVVESVISFCLPFFHRYLELLSAFTHFWFLLYIRFI